MLNAKLRRALSQVDSDVSEVEELERDDLFFELVHACEANEVTMVGNLLKIMCLSEVVQLDSRLHVATFGLTPLHCARSRQVAELLIDFGVPVNIQGACKVEPLFSAAKHSPDVVKTLLDHGASVESCSSDGISPLHVAVIENHFESVKLLVAAGADVNKQDCNGNTPLHMINGLAVAKYLIGQGAEIDIMNEDGHIALEEAVSKGRNTTCIEVANYLFDNARMRSRSKMKQLLDTLFSHILDLKKRSTSVETPHADKAEEHRKPISVRDILIPVAAFDRTASGSSWRTEEDESKEAFESKDDPGATDSKWRKVKKRVFGGRVKMVKLAEPPNSVQRDWAQGARAAFARKSKSGSESSRTLNAKFFHSFFELMVRDRPELALRILDKQRKLKFSRMDSMIYTYDMALIGTPLRCTAAVKEMVRFERFDLLSHPVTNWAITAKFAVMTRYCIFADLTATLVLGALLLVTFDPTPGHVGGWFSAWGRLLTLRPDGLVQDGSLALVGLLWLALMVLNLKEVVKAIVLTRFVADRRDIKCQKRMTKMLLFGGSMETHSPVTSILPHFLILFRDWNWVHLFGFEPGADLVHQTICVVNAACFMLLAARALQFSMGLYESFGLTLNIIGRMFMESRLYFQLLFTLVGVFSLVFYTLYADSGVDAFGSVSESFITLFFFVFNLDQDLVLSDPKPLRRAFALVVLGIYLVIVTLTVVNLIIAVFSNSYEETRRVAKAHTIMTRAAYVLAYEEFAARASLFRLLLNKIGYKKWHCDAFCNARAWRKWEKVGEGVSSRNVIVREFRDGRVEVCTSKEILLYTYRAIVPPFFTRFASLYDSTSRVFFPMPLLEDFSWSNLLNDEKASDSICSKNRESSSYGSFENKLVSQRSYSVSSVESINSDYVRSSLLSPRDRSISTSDTSGLVVIGYFLQDPAFVERNSKINKGGKGDDDSSMCK